MTPQFETAMKILTDIYGYPKWEKETKDGQSYDAICTLWNDELKSYDVEQVKRACYRLAKYRKSMTFPTISHLMSELVDEEPVKEDGGPENCLKMLLSHEPPYEDIVIQRTLWEVYKYKYNGYNPEEDKRG